MELLKEHLPALVELAQLLNLLSASLVFVPTDKLDPESPKQLQLVNPDTEVLS